MISQHFDKNNLHHAYLIESEHEEALGEVLKFLTSIGVDISKNPDFYKIAVDTFKVDDARSFKALSSERGAGNNKKIFIISANNFLLEAQNTLLKIFEEPIADTHFFIIVPDIDTLLPTLVSRFYLIKNKNKTPDLDTAQKFIKMSLRERLDFTKELLTEEEEEDVISLNSTRTKALKFINSVEVALHGVAQNNLTNFTNLQGSFKQIFKVRQFLRQPGSSAKSLLESVCLTVPRL